MKPILKVTRAKLFGKVSFYTLDFQHLTFRKLKSDPSPGTHPIGSLMVFFGKPIFLIRNQDSHFIWFPGMKDPILISKVHLITRFRFGILKQLEIQFDGKTRSFFQLNWSGLNEQVDPLYDSFDKYFDDNMYHLEVTRRRQIEKDRENPIPREFNWE